VLVFLPEAHAIAAWLNEPEQQAVREAFLAAYPRWKRAVGGALKQLAALEASGDTEAFLTAHRAQWRRRVLCAFNRDGDCTIYPVRPTSCRNAHAVETHELCSGANTGERPAQRLAFPPLDQFRSRVGQVLCAAHHAMGGRRREPESVCDAVSRLLAADGQARR